MTKGLFITIFGLGGYALDPASGMRTITAEGIKRGLTARAEPYNYTDTQLIFDVVRGFVKANPGKPMFMCGDSCGANVLTYLISILGLIGIDVTYAAPIQASTYCNNDSTGKPYPNIAPNCKQIHIFYSDWIHTGGLGVFVAQPESIPAKPIIRGDWHVVNGGKTLYRADYVPAPHPDDNDVANVQNPIMADIDAILNTGMA